MENSTRPNDSLEFLEWLKEKQQINVYINSKNRNIELTNRELIQFGGNLMKHNLFNSFRNIDKNLCKNNSTVITQEDVILDRSGIFEWFCDDILVRELNLVAEKLVKIYNSLYFALYPVFRESYKQEKGIKYSYICPKYCETDRERIFFWDLMNLVRNAKPRW